MTGIAKVHISLVEGILQIEGSEDFVSQQIARLGPHIIGAFENREVTKAPIKSEQIISIEKSSANSLDEYQNLFAINGSKVQILKSIPGTSNSQKTVNIALLLSYAHALLGSDSISSKVVSETCKSHACLDAGNFSSQLKGQKAYFILDGVGKGQSKNIRLTMPGKKKAEELAKQLNAS